jgi:hypothetical protein
MMEVAGFTRMTYFEHPWFLLLASLVPLVIWGSLQARPRALRHPVVRVVVYHKNANSSPTRQISLRGPGWSY